MEFIDLKRLNLTIEESRDIINFIAQKRGISTEKLLSTIKPNLKHKNNEILTTKTQQNMAKTQQKLRKSQQNMAKTQQKLRKSQQNMAKTQEKLIKSQKKNTTKTNKITTRTNKITKKKKKHNKN